MSDSHHPNSARPGSNADIPAEDQFHIVVSSTSSSSSESDRARRGQGEGDPSAADQDPTGADPFSAFAGAGSAGARGFSARFTQFAVPARKPWWFWPVAIVALVLTLALALIALALLIILAVPYVLFLLIRAWVRGFLPARGPGGRPVAGPEAGMRQNVRVLPRRDD